jgi:hypothetical protein
MPRWTAPDSPALSAGVAMHTDEAGAKDDERDNRHDGEPGSEDECHHGDDRGGSKIGGQLAVSHSASLRKSGRGRWRRMMNT